MTNQSVSRVEKIHEERRNQDVLVFHSLKSTGDGYQCVMGTEILLGMMENSQRWTVMLVAQDCKCT